jgi:regulator of sigma E protease
LIAAWYLEAKTWIAIIEVAIALGLVIFVHELGHFLVAKFCGVKCEKFYLGFDIAGLKLCKFRWGETEYGIGILPLGGYVKMLGQEDNPARLREEIERAKLPAAPDAATSADAAAESAAESVAEPADAGQLEAARQALFDPRSYLAQSVPRRMAIISAGVVMNLIFAWVVGVLAFPLGVRQAPCGVGQIMPGEGAWRADLRVGDEILDVNGQPVQTFQQMLEAVTFGDAEQGIPLVVRRPGVKNLLHMSVTADAASGRPRIGVASPYMTTLNKKKIATLPGTTAAESDPPLLLGDKIVELNEQAVDSYAEIHDYLSAHPDKPLRVTVERTLPVKKGTQSAKPQSEQVVVRVAPNPMRWLGLVMEMGPISALQADSPAAAAGLKKGDLIRRVDGKEVTDPMTLPDGLRGREGQSVSLSVERDGKMIEVPVTLRHTDGCDAPMGEGNPMTIPSLGVAYRVGNRVRTVATGTPAAAAGLHSGDLIVKTTIFPPDAKALDRLRGACHCPDLDPQKAEISFDEEYCNWPFFSYVLQDAMPESKIELQWSRNGKTETATLEPVVAAGRFNPDRGFLFEPKTFLQTAHSFGEAVSLGTKETVNSMLVVYRSIQKIGSGRVSARNLGGPLTIFSAAKGAAEEGLGNLLIFLTLLSANLAVLNFLPIPLLDGGHMVLLAWEGLRGKPADERVQLVLTYCGLFIILALMVWVLGLDLHVISRNVH